MLDAFVKPVATPYIDRVVPKIRTTGFGITPVVLIGFALGFTGCFFIGMQYYALGLIFLLLNRLFASVANAMARSGDANDLAAFLSLIGDFIIYGAFAFFFSLGFSEHALAAAFLIFSYLAIGMSYWGHAFFAAKRGVFEEPKGGIVGTTEMVLFMIICCLYPPGFSAFASLFALLCWVTAGLSAVTTIRMIRV